jgi:hypothetical protein
MDLKHEAGHNLKIRYDWMHSQGEDYEQKDVETPAFKEWTLLQIEGEEPVPLAEPTAAPEKAAAGKRAPPPKKVVEEVIDNRPRTI